MINRTRSGHCFDKKTLYKMKIVENNICTTCNTLEDAEHLILDCKRYKHIRIKYDCLSQTPRFYTLKKSTNVRINL